MAKEATFVILDCNNSELSKANSICFQLIGHSILYCKKEDIGVLLLNSNESSNRFYDEEMEGYSNIQDYIPLQPPNFKMFERLSKIVSTDVEDGDWLASFQVVWDIVKIQSEFKKYKKTKIVLFTDFKGKPNDDHFEDVFRSITEEKTSVVFVSNLITKKENEQGESISALETDLLKTGNQKRNSKMISKLLDNPYCQFSDYEHALFEVINTRNSSPWMWSSTLSIGSKVSMNISAFISIKDEFKLELKSKSTVPDMQVINSTKYFKNIEEINPAPEDLVKGFMLGSTPIPIDEEYNTIKMKTKKGLQCLFFTKESCLSRNCFSGNGTYTVVPKKLSKRSSLVFNSLVQYLHQSKIVMIARKVYNDNNKPKIVALIPKIANNIPQFIMIEMFFSNQFVDMHFPKLNSKANELNETELNAVENFINSKTMSIDSDFKSFPNLAMNFSVNFFSKHVNGFDVLDNKFYLAKSSLPSEIIEQMKEHFNLEPKKGPVARRKVINQDEPMPQAPTTDVNQGDYVSINKVGTVTPADDFIFLVVRDVSQLNDVGLQRHNFDRYADQIQNVIESLLFKSMVIHTEKIALALETYKKEAEVYNAEEYNTWMLSLKIKIQIRKMTDFWENVIVQRGIGLIAESSDQLNFFAINKEPVRPAEEEDNQNVDDMFDDM